MTTNPSHILIARNSRGTHNPSASLSSPTETHAAAAGIFRMDGSPPPDDFNRESDDPLSDFGTNEEESIEIDETFTKDYKLPGTVKIIVQNVTFWAHKEILFFASPFFEAVLSGNWAETGRRHSVSSVITISQRSAPGGAASTPQTSTETETIISPTDSESEQEQEEDVDAIEPSNSESDQNNSPAVDSLASPNSSKSGGAVTSESADDEEKRKEARNASLAKLQGGDAPNDEQNASDPMKRHSRRGSKRRAEATIVLREERASAFQDFLKFFYPHLECTITWNNVESLMNIADKLSVPMLYNKCLKFLLDYAAGKPIKALRLAEIFQEDELYREASRFVLDNPGGWSEYELNTLSQETLLKLEKRRTWFLERVLKLGLVAVAKEYQCCATCPDSSNCARLLEEKWRQCFQAAFRFGAPQPSMVFRYLRNLDASPPLSLTHLSCQASAKAFTATLFDRMFSLGIRGSSDNVPPSRVTAAGAVASATAGPRRHFLFCSLKNEWSIKLKKAREVL